MVGPLMRVQSPVVAAAHQREECRARQLRCGVAAGSAEPLRLFRRVQAHVAPRHRLAFGLPTRMLSAIVIEKRNGSCGTTRTRFRRSSMLNIWRGTFPIVDCATVGVVQSRKEIHKGAFTRSNGTNDPDVHAFFQPKRNIFQDWSAGDVAEWKHACSRLQTSVAVALSASETKDLVAYP